MRVELPDGQWAELRERINHATEKRVKVALNRGHANAELAFDFDTEVVRAFVSDWSVKDIEGLPIAIADVDAIERAPGDIIDRLAIEATQVWTGRTFPNLPTPPSSAA